METDGGWIDNPEKKKKTFSEIHDLYVAKHEELERENVNSSGYWTAMLGLDDVEFYTFVKSYAAGFFEGTSDHMDLESIIWTLFCQGIQLGAIYGSQLEINLAEG